MNRIKKYLINTLIMSVFVLLLSPIYVSAQMPLYRAYQDSMTPSVKNTQEAEAKKAAEGTQTKVPGAGTGDSQTKVPGPGTGTVAPKTNTKSGPCGDKICNPLGKDSTLDGIIQKILRGLNVIAAMVVTFFIIFAGFKYVTAMGDEKKITDAHNMLKWTVIGAAVLFGAQVIGEIIKTTVTELTKVK